MFGWLSGEIRDRKHLRGEPHYLFGALFDGAELQSFVYGVIRAKRARNLLSRLDETRYDNADLVSHLSSQRETKEYAELVYRVLFSLAFARLPRYGRSIQ